MSGPMVIVNSPCGNGPVSVTRKRVASRALTRCTPGAPGPLTVTSPADTLAGA
ncbi:MAG: hypothetical protein BWX84_01926 [Verrucomicrobia bacterium ADurb.Bin118]|nr:MAG: hypothetical protein BWX84_01926 [Verrucomicrobia bacterium ADurb.Bin118]